MGLKAVPPLNTKVRLTGVFLASTGQQVGPEGQRRWLTVKCGCGLCKLGNHVALQEVLDEDDFSTKRTKPRHIALANLEIVGAPPKAEDYP